MNDGELPRPGTDASESLVRAAGARVACAHGRTVVVDERGQGLAFEGDSAALCAFVLRELSAPSTREALQACVEANAEGPVDGAVIDELVGRLRAAGLVVAASAAARPNVHADSRLTGRAVLAVSGAIAAVDAPRTVLALQRRGFEVRVVLTDTARRFVSVEALEATTHRRVGTSLWSDDPASPVPHLDLASWADVVVIHPASATTISRIARGDCSDLLSALAISTRAPVLVAPSMNQAMLTAPSVARNIATLEEDGFFCVLPSVGIEVADPPQARPSRVGGALSPELVADLACAVLVDARRRDASERPRQTEIDWEAVHAAAPAEGLPWESPNLDDALIRVLDELAPSPLALLDVGTGAGIVAREAAQRGHRVVATDVSSAALSRARARAGALPIVFVRDDATDTRVAGTFDVVVDRGTLHGLTPRALDGYAKSLGDWLRPGGALVVVHDADDASPDYHTLRMSPQHLADALGRFELARHERATLRIEEPGRAWLTVLRRRAPTPS